MGQASYDQRADVRFWGKVEKTDGCWEWTSNIGRNGYGRFLYRGALMMAHRFAYERDRGPIPEGLELDHLCSNRRCVRPSHLDPVTHRENIVRSLITTPGINARKVLCDRGHPLSGANLKVRPCGRRECRECARLRQARFKQRQRSKLSQPQPE